VNHDVGGWERDRAGFTARCSITELSLPTEYSVTGFYQHMSIAITKSALAQW
jgi:hypothetical protein